MVKKAHKTQSLCGVQPCMCSFAATRTHMETNNCVIKGKGIFLLSVIKASLLWAEGRQYIKAGSLWLSKFNDLRSGNQKRKEEAVVPRSSSRSRSSYLKPLLQLPEAFPKVYLLKAKPLGLSLKHMHI